MAAVNGRREANKQATRAALTTAANQLFAERGYDGTTVRDISRAAKVTERTFYRYFDGKEGLLDDEYLAWLALTKEAITARPPGEAPFAAVRGALTSVARTASQGGGPAPLWLFSEFSDRPPVARGRRSAFRPLVRFEACVAEAVLARLQAAGASGATGGDQEFRAQILARVAVAAFRSAIIRHRQLRDPAQGVGQLIGQAFAILAGEQRGD